MNNPNDTEDLINRARWVVAQLDGLKHSSEDADVRRHLGRAKSSCELAVERLRDRDEAA